MSLGLPGLLICQQPFHALAVGSHEHQERLVELIESSDLKPIIDTTFPLSELAAGPEHLAAGKHFGKVVIELDG